MGHGETFGRNFTWTQLHFTCSDFFSQTYAVAVEHISDPSTIHIMILRASFSIEQYPFQFSVRIKKIGDNGANRVLHAGLRMDPWHLRDRQKRPTVVKDLYVVLMVAFNSFVIAQYNSGN